MRVKGQEQIAALFGVAPKTITEWQVMGFPVAVQGGPGIASEYDAPACVAWLVEREVRKVRAESPKDRLSRLQGDKIEQDMLRDRKLLIAADEVEPLWASAVLAAREYLLGEPPRLASLAIGLDKPAVEKLLSETFATFLTRLAAWREVGDPDEDDTDKPDEDELA
jgi:terminase small subunit / prophage DNA-packing protein